MADRDRDVASRDREAVEDLVYELDRKLEYYINTDKMVNDILQILRNNTKGFKNRCVRCNVDMGEGNSRQLCCKTYCGDIRYNSDYEEDSQLEI